MKKTIVNISLFLVLSFCIILTSCGGGGGGGGGAAGPADPAPTASSEEAPAEEVPSSVAETSETPLPEAPEVVLSSNAEILAFVFEKDENAAVLNDLPGVCADSEVTVTYPFGTISADGKTSLLPTIRISDGATIYPASGIPQDFTSTVTYVVTAEDGTENEWSVNLSELDSTQRSITYELSDGSVSGVSLPSSYNINTDDISLPSGNEIHKDNYIFAGWMDQTPDSETEGSIISGWGFGERNDNVILEACWEPAPLVTDSKIFANGHNLVVESQFGFDTKVFFYDNQSNKTPLASINSQYPTDYTNYEIFAGHSGNDNTKADYPLAVDCTIDITGGKLSNVYGSNGDQLLSREIGADSYITVSDNPTIGNQADSGIWLRTFTDKVVTINGPVTSADGAITLIAAGDVNDGTTIAKSADGNNYVRLEKFKLLGQYADETLGIKADGSNIVVEGNVSLPVKPQWVEGGNGRIHSNGTIFSIFVENGYFTVPSDTIDGGEFDMAIVYRTDNKTEYLDSTGLTTTKKLKYVQFKSLAGELTSAIASRYLAGIHFYIEEGKAQITVNINMQTVPWDIINARSANYLTYFNGSFYEIIENGSSIKWTNAYNGAKQKTFDNLTGYLVTITSDVENKFIYDRLLKQNPKYQNVAAKYAQSWLGASRSINQSGGYDSPTWTHSNNNTANDWYWVCGPEAGEKFYSGKVWNNGEGQRVPGKYAAWDNKDERELNHMDTSQWTEPNGNAEYFAQYSGQYVWNDLNNDGGSKKPTAYIVEYSVYGAQSPDHRVLTAKQTYSARALSK